jgi:hypothetical protein
MAVMKNIRLDPLHLVSTPIPFLSTAGLETYAGLSADDPQNCRHSKIVFAVFLSIYGNQRLLKRISLTTLKPHERRFLSLDQQVSGQGLEQETRLCVLHRVPLEFVINGEVQNEVELDYFPDYEMYRTVVQYALPGKGMGSVIYETPPNLNKAGRKSEFLSFSNKIYLNAETETYLVFTNYSVSPNYSAHANVNFNCYDPAGNLCCATAFDVLPYDYHLIAIKQLLPEAAPGIYSFVASSMEAALIPLSVNVCRSLGGVSVEHPHPPQAYLMADWPVVNKIKHQAVVSQGR